MLEHWSWRKCWGSYSCGNSVAVDRGRCEKCVGGVSIKWRWNIVLFPQDFTSVDLVRYILVFAAVLAIGIDPVL